MIPKIGLFLLVAFIAAGLSFGQSKSSYIIARDFYFDKDYQKAATWFQKSIAENKYRTQSFRYLGVCKVYLGDIRGAKSDVFYSLQLEPDNDSTFAEIGRVYLLTGDLDSSLLWAKKALKKNPKCADYYDDMAINRFLINEYSDALNYENMAISLDATKSVFFYNRGVIKEKLIGYDSAKVDYEQAIKVNPSIKDRMDAYVNLANCEMQDHNYEKAIQISTKVLAYNSNVEQAITIRGLSFASLNKKEEACKDFKKLATINPELSKKYIEQYCSKR
jgi:tetratricopeptide (TPR) repeat protein